MFKTNSLKGKLLLPLIIGSIVIIISLMFILSKTEKNVLIESGTQMADLVTKQASSMRKIYAGKIMPKIQENGGYDSADWEKTKGAVPAAATLVNLVGHSLSESLQGTKLRLYSEHPFKNRSLQLNNFEKRSLVNLKQNPEKPYFEIIEKDGEKYMQYAIADVMAQGCVNCHNSHPLTSKNDWKVGDFRGAVAATIPLTNLESEISSNFVILDITVILLLLVLIIISFIGINKVSNNIKLFQTSLVDFFSYLSREKAKLKITEINTNDEIGDMAKLVNKNILKTRKNNISDMKVLGEITLILNRVESGSFRCRIKSDTNNPMVKTLRNTINKMLDTVGENLDELQKTLQSYTDDDYTKTINISQKTQGRMRNILEAVNTLGTTLGNSSRTNLQNGESLQTNATYMKDSMNNLSEKANEQAASLEETAAALEELTSLTRNNTENAVRMGEFGKNVKNSVTKGQVLASKTATSMEEINEKVTSINEAITVIDQIAFQTNILSLNAAVEAATAGEAGKGFAVVAAEVRNLAARSAEAAKEIKELVEDANEKANQGKSISDEMINGYESLNNEITKNISIIDEVNTASKEQMTGIEQINDAVTMLDRVTQENARESNQVTTISNEVSTMANTLVVDAKNKKFN
jgi:methyl-accepting chemotaxis protein